MGIGAAPILDLSDLRMWATVLLTLAVVFFLLALYVTREHRR